jgi:hypothetical protein
LHHFSSLHEVQKALSPFSPLLLPLRLRFGAVRFRFGIIGHCPLPVPG